jgi:ribosomal protein S18 acetylase RimI-like enzyme
VKPLFWFSKYYQQDPVEQSVGGSPFQIRAATSKDLTSLAEILADSFHSRAGMGGWVYPLLRLGIYEDLRNRLNSCSPRYICLVAVTSETIGSSGGDRLVGTVEMALRSTHPWLFGSSPQSPYLSNLAVHHDCRRQGAARQLLTSCERLALRWGFQDLYLHVLENNHQARRLYFKLGYRLHQIDGGWTSLLLRKPRRLLLHKHLSKTTTY